MRKTVWFFLAAAAAPFALGLGWLILSIDVSSVAFPSGGSRSTLTRTRVAVGDHLRMETWSQPSNFSYSIWVPFTRQTEQGRTLQCRLESKGWLRPQSLHRNLVEISCRCERAWLHHDRQVSCPGL